MTFTFVSKCRLCGETIQGGSTGDFPAVRIACQVSNGDNPREVGPDYIGKQLAPSAVNWHYCKDGSIGMTDLLGAKASDP